MIWFWIWREGASQQLGLEIVRPRCLAAEKDVTLAQLGQSYVFLQSDGLVNVQAKYDKIDLVLFLVTV